MAHHDEKACMFQVEIGVNIDYWIVSYLNTAVSSCRICICLHGILSQTWNVIGGIILCEISHICPEITSQYVSNLKAKIDVTVEIERRNRQNSLVA